MTKRPNALNDRIAARAWVAACATEYPSNATSVTLSAGWVFKNGLLNSQRFKSASLAYLETGRAYVERLQNMFSLAKYENGQLVLKESNSPNWHGVEYVQTLGKAKQLAETKYHVREFKND